MRCSVNKSLKPCFTELLLELLVLKKEGSEQREKLWQVGRDRANSARGHRGSSVRQGTWPFSFYQRFFLILTLASFILCLENCDLSGQDVMPRVLWHASLTVYTSQLTGVRMVCVQYTMDNLPS